MRIILELIHDHGTGVTFGDQFSDGALAGRDDGEFGAREKAIRKDQEKNHDKFDSYGFQVVLLMMRTPLIPMRPVNLCMG